MKKIILMLFIAMFVSSCGFVNDTFEDIENGIKYYDCYEVYGFEFIYYVDRDYKSPAYAKKKIEEVAKLFEPYIDKPLSKLNGITFYVTEHKPSYMGQAVIGKTYPGKSTEVHGPWMWKDGGGLYELRLHWMNVLFPGQSEGEDIKWMKEHNVL